MRVARAGLGATVASIAIAVLAQSPSHPKGAPPIAVRAAAVAPAVKDGATLFAEHCAACHGAGPGHPGTAALAFKYKDQEPALLSERTDLDPDAIKLFVRNGISAMPFFRKTEIGDADLDRLAQWLSRAGKTRATAKR